MALTSQVTTAYWLADLPGLEYVHLTQPLESPMPLFAAFGRLRQSAAVPPSVLEAALFRMAGGAPVAELERELTRTAAVYLRDSERWYVAVDDELLRQRRARGLRAPSRPWVMPESQRAIRAAVRRAESTDRVVAVDANLADAINEASPDGIVAPALWSALLGCLAEPYAGYLRAQCVHRVEVRTLLTDDLERRVPVGHVQVCGCVLPRLGFYERYAVYVDEGPHTEGVVHGIRNWRTFAAYNRAMSRVRIPAQANLMDPMT